MSTRTQLSFKLTRMPPPGMDSTRWVLACDQENSGGVGDGACGECGKPKSLSCGPACRALESCAARESFFGPVERRRLPRGTRIRPPPRSRRLCCAALSRGAWPEAGGSRLRRAARPGLSRPEAEPAAVRRRKSPDRASLRSAFALGSSGKTARLLGHGAQAPVRESPAEWRDRGTPAGLSRGQLNSSLPLQARWARVRGAAPPAT